MKPTATLKNARRCTCTVRPGVHYHGKVYGDTNKRYADGTDVVTTTVVCFDGDLVVTKNSIYKLEG